MSDRVEVEYNVKVTGLEEAKASANAAASSANQATAAMETANVVSTDLSP